MDDYAVLGVGAVLPGVCLEHPHCVGVASATPRVDACAGEVDILDVVFEGRSRCSFIAVSAIVPGTVFESVADMSLPFNNEGKD